MPKANFLLRSSVFLTCCCIQGSTMWLCQRLMFSSLRALFRRSRSSPRVGVQHGLHDVGRQIWTIFFSSSSRRCGTREARVLLWSLKWPNCSRASTSPVAFKFPSRLECSSRYLNPSLPRCGWRLVRPSARRTTLRLASRRLALPSFGIDSLLLNTKLQDTWHA